MTEKDLVEAIARELAPISWAALGVGDTLSRKNRRAASLRHARAALQAIQEQGYVVVPKEPEGAQQADGRDIVLSYFGNRELQKPVNDQWQIAREVYRAMIAAAHKDT